jgi:hypothetical protein
MVLYELDSVLGVGFVSSANHRATDRCNCIWSSSLVLALECIDRGVCLAAYRLCSRNEGA